MIDNELVHVWKNNSYTSGELPFLLLLVVADCGFIFLHILLITGVLDSPLLSLGHDRGYSEIFQYIKEFWIIALLLIVLTKTRTTGYGVWALLFLYLLLDDALQLHETFGVYLANRIDLNSIVGLRIQDFGELAISATAAALLLMSLILPYLRGAPAFRQTTKHLLLLILSLAFFGVFVDMLHVMFRSWNIAAFLEVVEEGGEMLVVSVIVWYVYVLNEVGGLVGITLRSPR